MEPDYNEEVGFARDDHYCRHGVYVGGWAGPDYMCGMCEMGADIGVSYLGYRIITKMLNASDRSVRHDLGPSRTFTDPAECRREMWQHVARWARLCEVDTPTFEDDVSLYEVIAEAKGVDTEDSLVIQFQMESFDTGGWFTTQEYKEFKEEGIEHTVTVGAEYLEEEDDEPNAGA